MTPHGLWARSTATASAFQFCNGLQEIEVYCPDEENHNTEIVTYGGISNGRFVAYDKGIIRPMLMINGRQFVIYHSADEGFKTYEIQDDGKVTLVS